MRDEEALEEEQEPLEPVLSKDQIIAPQKEASKFKLQAEMDEEDEDFSAHELSEKDGTQIERVSQDNMVGSGTEGLSKVDLATNGSPVHVVQLDFQVPAEKDDNTPNPV